MQCPKCGETNNLHPNYDYSDHPLYLVNVTCNECKYEWDPEEQNVTNEHTDL